MIRWFIGYDKDESVAAYVLADSLQSRSSIPIQITFLNRRNLVGIFDRPRGNLDSTDFSISRFLVPYLCNYEGFAIFSDSDMLCRDDPAKLWAWRDERFAVQVVKHNYQPKEEKKFLDQPQTKYLMKNWSSLMMFNNNQCRKLAKDYVCAAPGLDLHQFSWLRSPFEGGDIGELPRHWNHLVGYDPFDPTASMVHFTTGGPYFNEYRDCQYADEWFHAKERMESVRQK
jgi:hypothetical protein